MSQLFFTCSTWIHLFIEIVLLLFSLAVVSMCSDEIKQATTIQTYSNQSISFTCGMFLNTSCIRGNRESSVLNKVNARQLLSTTMPIISSASSPLLFSETDEYYYDYEYYDDDDESQQFQRRDDSDTSSSSSSSTEATATTPISSSSSDSKNPLDFLKLLGTDFQPGRLVNIFFGLIILLFMLVAQGYAMWVFGIAFLPGTRSINEWEINTEAVNEILSALEKVGNELEDENNRI